MAQGETVIVSDPRTPVEVSFRLRYTRARVDRLADPGNYAAVRFGGVAEAAGGATIELPGAEIAVPPFQSVPADDAAVRVVFTIPAARFGEARDGKVRLVYEYCRFDGSSASPPNDLGTLGYVQLRRAGG